MEQGAQMVTAVVFNHIYVTCSLAKCSRRAQSDDLLRLVSPVLTYADEARDNFESELVFDGRPMYDKQLFLAGATNWSCPHCTVV